MEKQRSNRVKEILESVDSMQQADVPPFFYTKLKVRMENELLGKKAPAMLLRPAFLTASLSLLLVINVIFLFMSKGHPAAHDQQKPAGIESFAEAYNLNTPSVYE